MIIATFIFSCIAAFASLCAILAFFFARKKETRSQIESDAVFKNEFKHLRDGVDDLRLDVRDIMKTQEQMSLHVSNDNTRLDSLESRVTRLEQRMG